MGGAPTIFISYAREDASKARRLTTHLRQLECEGAIQLWSDVKIEPGEKWRDAIDTAMRDADVALFLVSADFLNSDFCQNVEVPYLLRKSHATKTIVVPIIVDHCDWQGVEWIAEVNVLPESGKPVMAHRRPSEAWTAITREMRDLVKSSFAKMKRISSVTPPPVVPAAAVSHSLEGVLAKLPEAGNDLFGREDELDFLDDALDDESIAVAALVGFGGVGKSALVRHWLTHHVVEENYRFMGVSFYSQGTHEQAGSSDQFLVQSLRDLGDREPNRGLLSLRAGRLADLIIERPTVLILDGLEPLQYGLGVKGREGHVKDAGIRELLEGLLQRPGKSLCVVTTRVPLDDPTLQSEHLFQRNLDVLSTPAAIQLLRSRGIRGTDAELKKAAVHLGHHALALVLAAEYLDTFKEGEVIEAQQIPLIAARTSQARHAHSVMEAYVRALQRDGNPLDFQLLSLLGLFDRPAAWTWMEALFAKPAIEGVTDALVNANRRDISESLSRLRQWELVLSPSSLTDRSIDAHPLVREFFGEWLRDHNPRGWPKAHDRLYEHLRDTAEQQPETLPAMTPLMLAVAHGCKAGRYRDVLHEVYRPRIMRGDQLYAAQQLGAMASLLSVLMQFFPKGDWQHPSSAAAADQVLDTMDQINLLTHVGMCLTALRGYAAPEVEQCYAKARDLCLELGETRDLFIALYGLWRFYLVRGDAKETRELASRLYMLREVIPNTDAVAERVMCATYFYDGDMRRAAHHGEAGVRLQRPADALKRDAALFTNEPVISCLWYWGMAQWFLGDADGARVLIDDSVARARSLGHPHTLAITLMYDAMLSQFCGDAVAARATAEELIALCAVEGFSLWHSAGEMLRGWARTRLGESEAGANEIKSAMRDWAAKGGVRLRVYCLGMLADIHRERGEIEEGLEAVAEGIQFAAYNEQWLEAEMFRLKGELLLLRDPKDVKSPEEYFERARTTAQQQGALALELRTTMSRGVMLHSRGNGTEAVENIATLYSRFKSGFNTADMIKAKMLVHDWSEKRAAVRRRP